MHMYMYMYVLLYRYMYSLCIKMCAVEVVILSGSWVNMFLQIEFGKYICILYMCRFAYYIQ